jgi:predicted 2-oxoglutarate/Fe(II)-dependent dioxygenase YbiX
MADLVNGFFPGELLPTNTVAGCIDIFENAWSNPEETIAAVEKEVSDIESGVHWSRATTIGRGAFQNARTNSDLNITFLAKTTNSPVLQNLHTQLHILLLASTIPYARKHDLDTLYHEDYSMLKYKGGQGYVAHSDGTTATGRAISAIVYLNNEFEGGEVEFVNFGVKIKPQPGMLLLFPSTYPYTHIAHPVTSGVKYALVTWIRDRPFQ